MSSAEETDKLLGQIEGNSKTLVGALRAIIGVRTAGEDGDGIGAKAERDVGLVYKAIGDDLRTLKLIK